MKTFYEQIREVQDERKRNEFWETQKRIASGENIYAWYCAWCNAYNDGNGKTDGATFDLYCEEQGVAVDFWKRKAIGENHFGEIYSYRHDIGKWEIAYVSKIQN